MAMEAMVMDTGIRTDTEMIKKYICSFLDNPKQTY
ncbi:hypothetical protein M2459_002063 [Parabacteroides sp. PF5-5]|nr:hypothetical protein [Parabacteroides sp. PF5-13]MDH6327553.1 hypothetical protein [Parabacteroides sp. PH5-41]MDH6335307.1 hypothetical protein [Parabacteroides sp. PF5-5]MDH6346370.1 hypothetical protein [Parabacteroides sp. PH5-46]MDH6361379.1 hypothetical protein [Parabacteroides sp. PH5-16]MDH6377046.1 hypothetical protein [Parabacteroides sp. PH5-33]